LRLPRIMNLETGNFDHITRIQHTTSSVKFLDHRS
jgi:hypothetical protein